MLEVWPTTGIISQQTKRGHNWIFISCRKNKERKHGWKALEKRSKFDSMNKKNEWGYYTSSYMYIRNIYERVYISRKACCITSKSCVVKGIASIGACRYRYRYRYVTHLASSAEELADTELIPIAPHPSTTIYACKIAIKYKCFKHFCLHA